MKVLFVYSLDSIQPIRKPLRSWSNMQLGISYISSLLRNHGHQISLLVLGSNFPAKCIELLKASVDEFDPGVICFTAVYSQYDFVEELARFTKNNWPDRYLLIGGAHATLASEEVISGPFDALCIGEGEYPTLELCGQLESGQLPGGIANLWIKSADGSIQKNSPREFIQNLTLLPLPDYEMWAPWISEREDDDLTILAGRGCPYDCTYCSNHALREFGTGKYVRTRAPEDILREVEFLYRKFPYRRIYLEIETLDCNKKWTIELCDKLAAFNDSVPDPIAYGSNYRINPQTIDEDLFAALAKANFKDLNIGLESGSERVRRQVLQRHYSNEDFLRVVSLARKYGMRIYVYNMIGLPGESLNDFRQTIELNRQCQPDGHHTGIFHPYPGTKLYETCLEQGLLDGLSPARMERRRPVIDLPDFSKSQIKSAYPWFHYHVYKGHRPLPRVLMLVALIKIDSIPTIKFRFQRATRLISALLFAVKKVRRRI